MQQIEKQEIKIKNRQRISTLSKVGLSTARDMETWQPIQKIPGTFQVKLNIHFIILMNINRKSQVKVQFLPTSPDSPQNPTERSIASCSSSVRFQIYSHWWADIAINDGAFKASEKASRIFEKGKTSIYHGIFRASSRWETNISNASLTNDFFSRG